MRALTPGGVVTIQPVPNTTEVDDLEFRLLGAFEVRRGNELVVVGGHRQRMVLAVLALRPGALLSQDRLIEEVWGESPPPAAVRTLHAYVSRLRAVLRTGQHPPTDVLVRRGPGYLLDVQHDQVDVERFERMVGEATTALTAGRPQEAARVLRSALSLWRGPAMGEFADERFAVTESLRLVERRLEALELRIDADLAMANHAPLVAELEGLVHENPLRERFWGQLMTALYRCGRQADALGAYHRLRRQLVDELGLEPAPELRHLEQLVLEQSPDLDWRAPEPGPGPVFAERAKPAEPVPGLLPFVGRQHHLDDLLGVVGHAEAGTLPRLVVVLGRPGYGKSRLLAEVGAGAAELGVLVARGSAEGDGAMSYRPFAGLVRSLLAATGADTDPELPNRAELAWLVPELGSPPTTSSADLDLARARLVESILGLFASAGQGEPLLIAVDDAHRLGETGAGLVREILDRPWSRPVTVVLSGRPAPPGLPDDHPLASMLRRDRAVVIDVKRLSTSDVAQLLAQLGRVGTERARQDLASTIVERTGGIPLLVREVLALDPASETGAGESDVASPLIEAVIGSHLAELTAPARRLLEVATVVGMEFEVGVLAGMSGRRPAEITELLDEARVRGFVVEGERFECFAFDHRLIKDVLGNSLSSSRRARLHAAAAEALASRREPLQAAEHALAGRAAIGDERAATYALDGGAHALYTLDFELARTLCERAIDDCEEASVGLRGDLLIVLGQATALSGQPELAEEVWTRAADLARASGDSERLCDVALAAGVLGRMLTGSELRWSLLSEALEATAGDWTPKRLRVAAAWTSEAATPARAAVDPALRDAMVIAACDSGDLHLLAEVNLASYVSTPTLADRRPWARSLRQVAEELADDVWRFRAAQAALIDAVADANPHLARRELAEVRALAPGLQSPRSEWLAAVAEAGWATLIGAFDEGERHARAGLAIGERNGLVDAPAAYGSNLFFTAYHRGQFAGLRPVFADLDPGLLFWSLGRAVAALCDGDPDEAALLLDGAVGRLSPQPDCDTWVLSVCLAAEVAAAVADRETVDHLDDMLAPYAGQFAVIGALAGEFGPTDRVLGNLASRQDDPVRAEAHFTRALEICDRMGAIPWRWSTAADQMVAARRAGLEPVPWGEEVEAAVERAGLVHAMIRMRAAR